MADMHSFTEPYLQKNFHRQTKTAIENKEEGRENRSTTAIWKMFPFFHNVLLMDTCPLDTWHTSTLSFLNILPFHEKEMLPQHLRENWKMKVLEEAPMQDVNTPTRISLSHILKTFWIAWAAD